MSTHGQPNGGTVDDAKIAGLLNDVNNLELRLDSLRGQDGITVRDGVIGFNPKIVAPPIVEMLTLCVTGAPGYVMAVVTQPIALL